MCVFPIAALLQLPNLLVISCLYLHFIYTCESNCDYRTNALYQSLSTRAISSSTADCLRAIGDGLSTQIFRWPMPKKKHGTNECRGRIRLRGVSKFFGRFAKEQELRTSISLFSMDIPQRARARRTTRKPTTTTAPKVCTLAATTRTQAAPDNANLLISSGATAAITRATKR